MSPELRTKIIAYNKTVAERAEKASDLDVIISAILKLAPGQVKIFLNDETVMAVLSKYGFDVME